MKIEEIILKLKSYYSAPPKDGTYIRMLLYAQSTAYRAFVRLSPQLQVLHHTIVSPSNLNDFTKWRSDHPSVSDSDILEALEYLVTNKYEYFKPRC